MSSLSAFITVVSKNYFSYALKLTNARKKKQARKCLPTIRGKEALSTENVLSTWEVTTCERETFLRLTQHGANVPGCVWISDTQVTYFLFTFFRTKMGFSMESDSSPVPSSLR